MEEVTIEKGKAIGIGIITETTKSTLLRLEGEKSDLEKRIQREQITNRRYTKAEIVASLEILGDYLSENDMQKRALFETFVDKVVAYKDGKIVVNVDVFGTKAKIESIDGVVHGVRTEKLVLRHQESQGLMPVIEPFLGFEFGIIR